MPQIIVLALAGAGLYAGYRWVRKRAKSAAREAVRRDPEDAQGKPRDLGSLERDPDTGVYRPKP